MEGLRIDHTTLPSPLPGSPSFIFHLTHLTNTLLLWIGTGQPTDPADPTAVITPVERKLAQDWAVAMPSTRNLPVAATSIYRGGGDIALPMSQRLARRFPTSQIHLSLSLPPSLTSASGPSLDPFASKVMLVMEKRLGAWLEEVLQRDISGDAKA
ncbi:hypothetical protein DB88DRAFT_490327 [Papiliotrema laurentii]|uniref:Uncharacterized protein n=1 Tax=Papiliotrema laurentii TaxID=5418 RepID=A0AAD9D114_PAPLA|nr:hypothetical protein DB88DRAFT_490327 [Papiliotrema laurentii]